MKIKGDTIPTQRMTIEFQHIPGGLLPFLRIWQSNGDDSVDEYLLTGDQAIWLRDQLIDYPMNRHDPRVVTVNQAPEGAPLVHVPEVGES